MRILPPRTQHKGGRMIKLHGLLATTLAGIIVVLAGVGNVQAHDELGSNHAVSDAIYAEKAKDAPKFEVNLALLRVAAATELHLLGSWGPVIDWPHIPVSAANLPDGRILTWAASQPNAFPRGPESTYAATWDPTTGLFQDVRHNSHDMFCAHNVMLEDGRVFVNGGRNTVTLTSVFDFQTNSWKPIDPMNDGRWYPTTVALPDGQVFTAMGSGGRRTAEIWREDQGWRRLTGLDLTPILNDSPAFEPHWWPYLHVTPLGTLLHSGPTSKMHAIDWSGVGTMTELGAFLPTSDWYPKHGISVMYDVGKILMAGGDTDGSDELGSSNLAVTIQMNGGFPTVTSTSPMQFPRRFHNAVVLPTGEVLVVGGNMSGRKFSDEGTVLAAELWNPSTGNWRVLADMSVPRNYHSVALLLPDGRVYAGGGGLCGSCSANHPDAQIYSPPYLFRTDGSPAPRPSIHSAPDRIGFGQVFEVQTSGSIEKFSLVKMSTLTHQVNTDVRYLPVTAQLLQPGRYRLTVSSNPNVLTPGYYMLFAIDNQGVPSTAKTLNVVSSITPVNTPPNGTIISPAHGTVFSATENTLLQLRAAITDAEDDDGELTCAWQTELVRNGVSSLDPVDHSCSTQYVVTGLGCGGDSYFYRFHLTVTDAGGLHSSTTATIYPDCVDNDGLIAYWPLDEGTGSTAEDASAFGRTGTIYGATWTTGMVGTALQFDGVDDTVRVAHSPELAFTASDSYTIAAWVKPSSLRGQWSGIVTKSRDARPWYGLWISRGNKWIYGGGNLPGGEAATGWHHLAAVQDAEAGQRRIYVNGILENIGTSRDSSGPGDLLFGSADSVNEFFAGAIDEVRIYDRALTDSQILALADASEPPPPPDGLIAYWPLDEGSGSVAGDVSLGSDHLGTIHGATWTAGMIGTALQFDGVDDTVRVAHSPELAFTASDSYTIAAWVKPSSLRGQWSGIVTKSRDARPWYGLWISRGNKWIYGGGNLPGGEAATGWHHLAAVQDAEAGQRRIYVDGILENIGTSRDSSGPGDLLFGSADGVNEFFAGTIDEVRIYDRALTDSQIQALAAGSEPPPPPPDGLVAYWPLDEGSGSVAGDVSPGSDHPGTIHGATWTTGMVGTALQFDGVDDTVRVAHSPELAFTASNSYTIAAWVKPSSLRGQWSGIVTKSRDARPWYGLWISQGNKWIYGGGNLPGGEAATGWHHLAAVQDAEAGQRRIYVDGILENIGTSRDSSGPGDLLFGSADSVNEFFAGTIDEVRIYDRALTDSQIFVLLKE